ncbi:MAG: outer membrane protein [Bradyrhizobium sp.]|jgi:outer membrane immunogenic protein
MKKINAVALLTLCSCYPAFAADLGARPYTKAPPVAASIYSWTGFYVGGNVGYAWAPVSYNHNETAGVLGPVVNTERFSTEASSFSGGLQVGYDHQFQNIVLGVEADYHWQDGSASGLTNLNQLPRTRETRFGDTWSVVGRLGYAWGPTLAYVRGGYANAELSFVNTRNFDGALLGESRTHTDGYVVGAGLAYGFAPNWSLGAEYNFYSFDPSRQQQTLNGVAQAGYNDNIDFNIHQVLFKLNYRFGAPFVAQY